MGRNAFKTSFLNVSKVAINLYAKCQIGSSKGITFKNSGPKSCNQAKLILVAQKNYKNEEKNGSKAQQWQYTNRPDPSRTWMPLALAQKKKKIPKNQFFEKFIEKKMKKAAAAAAAVKELKLK